MNPSDPESGSASGFEAEAAAWVVRHERGLTAAEQDAFSSWLAAHPRHRAAFAEQRWSWEELDRLNGLRTSVHAGPDTSLLAPADGRPAARWRFVVPLVAASLAVIAAFTEQLEGCSIQLILQLSDLHNVRIGLVNRGA